VRIGGRAAVAPGFYDFGQMDVQRLVDEIDTELRSHGSPDRAEREKAYLKSTRQHYGTSVPTTRAIAKEFCLQHPSLDHDDLVAVVRTLWSMPAHEDRMVVVELFGVYADRLGVGDIGLIEQLLRQSGTWALVDGLAASVTGRLLELHPELGDVLDRWSVDHDFWIRRSALLALLVPLRRGGGDFERLSRYADAMLDEREFFIRKAIGWVLRDTGRKRPVIAFDWLLPRAGRASGVTLREAVKPLSDQQREAIAARASRKR
jgi:3-methyladenine DNA glycosylase AlkD